MSIGERLGDDRELRARYVAQGAYRKRASMDTLFRSRSGGLTGGLAFSTVALGVLLISVPLELRQLHATPAETGVTLSMLGFGMFTFEWLWGVVADRLGYRAPLVVSLVLYAAFIALLSQARTVAAIAVLYFLASGMMVAVGPIARSYLGTSLRARLRGTGLALLTAQWSLAEAVGSGAGGPLIERFPISTVMLGAACLPLISAALVTWVFRGYSHADRVRSLHGDDHAAPEKGGHPRVVAVMVITAAVVCLVQIGLGGESALLPLLVTVHLHLSPGNAGAAMFAVGVISALLLVPGGNASDRWGRKPTMVIGGVVSAGGFVLYSLAGGFAGVLVAAAARAAGSSLLWPAATAWISESVPWRRHAFYMGLFGEFENIGWTLGPAIGGLVWSVFGIQSAFYVYAVAALAASLVVLIAVRNRGPMQSSAASYQDLVEAGAPGTHKGEAS